MDRQSESYDALRGWGLPVSTHYQVLDDIGAVQAYIDHYGEHRHSVEHELDGIVIKIDEVAVQRRDSDRPPVHRVGPSPTSTRPRR